MQVLGIDPGIHRTGWAIVDDHGGRFNLLDYGCITTPNSNSETDRLVQLANQINEVCRRYQVKHSAVEKLYVAKNVKTVISVSQARGVTLLCLARRHCSIAEYTPLQIKQALTGYGRADKQQIQNMVKSILHLPSVPRPDDAADAVAVGICHLQSYKLINKLS